MFKKTIAELSELKDTNHTVDVKVTVDAEQVFKPATKLICTLAAAKVIAFVVIKVADKKL